jgi:hypothetical protein
MLLSIFTTITDPTIRGDAVYEAFNCYGELADEVVIVDTGRKSKWTKPTVAGFDLFESKDKVIDGNWPEEFSWEVIGENFQRGYEACTGDWVIHADLDFIFHERDYRAIRMACENNPDAPALSFWKFQMYQPDRYNLKSRLIIAVNKGKYGDRIRFDSGGDLAQPSLDEKYIEPSDVPESGIPFYNYDFLTKTRDQVTDDVGRMDRAYERHFGKWLYSKDGTEESAYKGWLEMVIGRSNKPSKKLKLSDHPKVMQNTIKNLRQNQCGYSIFGNVKPCDYFVNNDKIELYDV